MMGLMLCCCQLTFLAGITLTSPTTMAIFVCLEPLMAALLGFISGMEDSSRLPRRLLSAVVAGVGVAVIFSGHEGKLNLPMHLLPKEDGKNLVHPIGCGLLLVHVVCEIFYYLIQTKLFEAGSSTRTPLLVTTCACGCAMPIYLLLVMLNVLVMPVDPRLTSFADMSASFSKHPTHGLSPLAGLVYAILFVSIISFLLTAMANKRLEAFEIIMYQAAQLPVTAVMSVLLLGEHMTRYLVIGAVLICGALFL